jgi:hypothetical protein
MIKIVLSSSVAVLSDTFRQHSPLTEGWQLVDGVLYPSANSPSMLKGWQLVDGVVRAWNA